MIMASLVSGPRWEDLASIVREDPNLEEVTDLESLHQRLQELSDALISSDAPDSAFRQLTFDGTNPNPTFDPNPFKKDKGRDGKSMTTYYRYAVKSEDHVAAAVEFACDKKPSTILEPSDGWGGLYHGGFKCVGNSQFHESCHVTHVVNTTKGLGDFFPKFKSMVQKAEKAGIEFLTLNWVDDEEQDLAAEVLVEAIQFVHNARRAGGSVLVHCAQGKSRSASMTVSYIAALEGKSIDEALVKVKAQRRMAQPNRNFMTQLKAHEAAGLFASIIDNDDAGAPPSAASTNAEGAAAEDAPAELSGTAT